MVIAIDFDGMCVSHEFPKVGKDIGAVPVLKKFVERGHKLILHTMRGDGQSYHNGELIERSGRFANCDSVLDDAVRWFNENGIPLKLDEDGSISRPYVDWERVEQLLKEKGVIDYPEKRYNTWRESINVCD